MRWILTWSALGVLVGVALMLEKVESGAKPGLIWYSYWIPIAAITAALFGAIFGVPFAILMEFTGYWSALIDRGTGLRRRYIPRVLCGAFVGGAVGWLWTRDTLAWVFVVLCLLTAVVSGLWEQHQRSGEQVTPRTRKTTDRNRH